MVVEIDYEIKNKKVIFNKKGVYFSVPVEDIESFVMLANLARLQLIRKETREETEEYLDTLRQSLESRILDNE